MNRLVAACLLLLSLLGCTDSPSDRPSPTGKTVFSFIDGSKKTLNDYHGQWLLVNFWSVTCPPCFEEMPTLNKLSNELAQSNLSIIGVAMPFDRPDMILQTQQSQKLVYPVSLDLNGEISSAFDNISIIPKSFLFNPDGRIVLEHSGIIYYEKFLQAFKQQQNIYQQGET